MNRLVTGVSAVCLGVALCAAPHADARTKVKKHKKNVDLSANPLAQVNSKQPDKELFDRAMLALKKGRYDVARLDLQTLLNTYPDTEYAMRAKLAVGDTWYKEGGAAALQQAESEYKDFITFFPNTPEAAEAQMKVGDIYYQQMEKPDRDPQNAQHAEQEYRTMIEQFPDSPLIPRAKQRLRDVQEVLAQRQFEIGQFYASREDYQGSIARLQTVVDAYPLFSASDQTLITLGDDYANEASVMSNLRLPAKAKREIVNYYNQRAVDAWDRVVTQYPMAPHVEDAKDRLIAMGRPVPEPTQQELAESEAEEASRVNLKFKDRALVLFKRAGNSTVEAARVGEPTLNDPPPTLAPAVVRNQQAVLTAALKGEPLPKEGPATEQPVGGVTVSGPGARPTVTTAGDGTGGGQGATATFEDVQNGGPSDTGNTSTVTDTGSGSAAGTPVRTPPAATLNSDNPKATPTIGDGLTPNGNPAGAAASTPIAPPVGPPDATPLPPVQKPAEAPAQINDVKSGVQVHTGNESPTAAKKKKAPFDKHEESSSKHKKKKGVDKLNPF
jgi:outer membrane protein assembly factor BamD